MTDHWIGGERVGSKSSFPFEPIDRAHLADVAAGRSFMPFRFVDESGHGRLYDRGRPEAAIAIEETYVLAAYGRAGLRVERIRRGDWWNGRADDQDVITAVR